MLLEKAIDEHKSAVKLLNAFSKPEYERNRMDDIFVRPYVVRSHWRERPKKWRKRLTNNK